MTDDKVFINPSKMDYVLYKIDRTIALIGIIVIAVIGLTILKSPNSQQIALAAISGLVGYVGGRSAK